MATPVRIFQAESTPVSGPRKDRAGLVCGTLAGPLSAAAIPGRCDLSVPDPDNRHQDKIGTSGLMLEQAKRRIQVPSFLPCGCLLSLFVPAFCDGTPPTPPRQSADDAVTTCRISAARKGLFASFSRFLLFGSAGATSDGNRVRRLLQPRLGRWRTSPLNSTPVVGRGHQFLKGRY